MPIKTIASLLVRHTLSGVAGGFALNSFLDAAQMDAFSQVVSQALWAAVFGAAAVAWSIVEKRYFATWIKRAQAFLLLDETGHVKDLVADVEAGKAQ